MRLFLALELHESVRDALERSIAPLRAMEPGLSWAAPEKRHLTLRFFGEVDDAGAERVVAATSAVARAHQPFEMRLGGIGAFPNFRRARVVWIGVETDPRLELLHHDLEVGLERAGFETEGRPFRPHVTLARVRAPLPEDRVRALARASRKVHFSGTQDVGEIVLLESTLAPSGARYRRVHAATLGGR
jgi:2'-5' RNA ligase